MMEDFSYFIHEEVFILGDSKQAPEHTDLAPVGVAGATNELEDQKLLKAILNAIKIDPAKAKISNQPNDSCSIWIDFGGIPQEDLFQVKEFEGYKVIASPTLQELRNTPQLKANLWKILQSHFDI